MVNTNSSKNKEKVREELYNFIRKNYTHSQLPKLKVLTLLSDKPYELEQIWDKLGVPRGNITTVERNPKTRENIKQTNPGIRVIEDYFSIDDYIADTNEQFDIINLDYCGNLNREQMDTLQDISSKRMLKDRGILATWYSGRREKEDTQNVLKAQYMSTLNSILALGLDPAASESDRQFLKNIVKKGHELSKSELERSETITSAITRYLTQPLTFEERTNDEQKMPEIIRLLGKEEKIVNAIENSNIYKASMKRLLNLSANEKILREEVGNKAASYYLNIRRKAARMEQIDFKDRLGLAKYFLGIIESLDVMRTTIGNWVKHELDSKNIRYDKENPSFIENIAHVLLYQNPQYLIFDNERYFYHGDNSTPMFTDFMLVGKKEFKDFSWYTKNGKLKLNLGTLAHFGYRELNRFADYLTNLRMTNILYMKSRKAIDSESDGNTAKRKSSLTLDDVASDALEEIKKYDSVNNLQSNPDNKSNPEIATKDKIYSLLREGKTTDEIRTLHPEYSEKQIGSYKAWITMKERKEALSEKEAIPVLKSNSLDSSLSKEDALLFLNDGYTPLEIANTFGVDVWQIRGYKGGQTRKINRNKEQYKKAS